VLSLHVVPDQAGIRGETREQSRRRPTAFIRQPTAQEWRPELRKELADAREGMHKVLNALLDSKQVSPREKAMLELLQNTGARLHEVVLMTVGGYRNEGVAGQARVVNKGSMGREVKTIYFAHNPKVELALTTYIEHIRPLHDPQGRKKLAQVSDQEPLFLTERGTPYSPKVFYWHWYKYYKPLQYLIYDHSRNGETALSVLADYQNDLSKRHYVSPPLTVPEPENVQETLRQHNQAEVTNSPHEETVWAHDVETLAWIKKLRQQAELGLQEG
jgi:hypothetical protein